MKTPRHCYCFSGIITIYFSLLIHTLASPPLHPCLQDQREALLEFRDEFPVDDLDPSPWNKSSIDCCFWKGVKCDDRSGQVISLNLSDTFLNGSLKTNSSLFRLQYLRHLILSYCDLNGEIPSSLGNLSRLTLVELSHNDLVGAIPSSVGKLNQLRYLSLAANELTGQVPASIGNLNELQVMSLSQNTLNGTIPISLANLTKLYHISLRSNNFTSRLPSNMSVFHNLEHFDVAANSFHGSFPKSLFAISWLQVVYLEDNQFTGPIEFSSPCFSFSPKLEILYLARNKFDGPIPESISKFLNLQDLDLSRNSFRGPIPRSISKLDDLRHLDFAKNKLEGEVPSCLWNFPTVMLSHNFFGSFENPSEETLIQALDLNSNSFRGPFPHWICKNKGLSFLDLSNNLFNGSIPPCLRNSIDYLTDLILHNNSFSGSLPDIFSNATELRMIDVGLNHLEGKFPKSLINCKSLKFVNMENNKIKDKFPSWLGSLPSLIVLSLRSNEFYGTFYQRNVPIGFPRLCIIDLSHNDLSGILPPSYFSNWLGCTEIFDFTKMTPTDKMMLDTGDFRIRTPMEMVNKGVEMRYEQIEKDFGVINLAGNRFYGKIPESIGIWKELRLLNLSCNAFTNDIPRSLANLTNLETLDLSNNKLSGQIPQDLGKLSFLSYMNFSHNLLSGPVPRGTQFQSQNCSSFSDNLGLYGLEDICRENRVLDTTSQHPDESPEAKEQMFNWIAAAIAYGPGVLCGLVIGHIFASTNQEWFTEKFGLRKIRVLTSAR
ncbi:hypothetical protein DY000_02063633 [Brassica cretica]|uniref:Leucine-rich repeat-containing N-terminal plant-type domain-containing protein n=1 Tax=Brassica cretica TaxID=69181 RepID=A0ABQ7AZ68_BRACR|nr:hypothetical protein DY000_02063633 [Brassica cretica]